MLEYGRVIGLPAKYRITLAISIALLLHTLVMSVLSFTSHEIDTHRRTLRVELASAGSQPSSGNAASKTADTANAKPTTQPSIDTPEPAQDRASATGDPSPSNSRTHASGQPPRESARSDSSAASAAGNPQVTTTTKPEPMTQTTRSPQETDRYLARLAARIGNELDKRPVPSSHRVTEPVIMELELHLMGGGALTDAKVIRSTGFREIDRAAHRAALLASPYPEPPEEHSERKRFRVELIFTPERL